MFHLWHPGSLREGLLMEGQRHGRQTLRQKRHRTAGLSGTAFEMGSCWVQSGGTHMVVESERRGRSEEEEADRRVGSAEEVPNG